MVHYAIGLEKGYSEFFDKKKAMSYCQNLLILVIEKQCFIIQLYLKKDIPIHQIKKSNKMVPKGC
jgi:hypothetical protein